MNKEELKDYLINNLEFHIRNDLNGNRHLVLTLEKDIVTSINLEQFFEK